MAPPLRAITVCVDYSDILALTLPYNKHHFSEIMVVTSWGDKKTQALCQEMQVRVHETDLFYMHGAKFNKWAALEEGLDHYKRDGWLCILDADVLWPKDIGQSLANIAPGFLYTPRRRMYPLVPRDAASIPSESEWGRYPCHRNEEFAGYSQIFHSSDSVLGTGPWHQIDWRHAGGADSFFQMRWKNEKKIRPPFEVLHLGEAGVNWAGRVTPYADGSLPEGADQKRREIMEMWRRRRGYRGVDQFRDEKIR